MKDKIKKNDGTYIFSDFSKGLYLLDTPRSLGEQMGSLAITGGRNIWSEKGALVPQYGYNKVAQVPIESKITGWSRVAFGTNSTFLVTVDGNVYLYISGQGLRKYKTPLDYNPLTPIITRRDKDMIIFIDGNTIMFGSYYDGSDFVEILDDVELLDMTTYYEFTTSLEDAEYFWNGKEICVKDSGDNEIHFTVTSVFQGRNDDYITVKCVNNTTQTVSGGNVSIGEKTNNPINLVFEPDNTGVTPPKPNIVLNPKLLEVSNNRLYVVQDGGEYNGYIFYSQIGVLDGFTEAYGSGYFGGFYNDSSDTLSIEEFMDGTLITKRNGIYYLQISDSVTIKKISQVGQEYASDHVIVGEKVYAYDSNSGALVNAVSVNVFGVMVSGKPLVESEVLNAENMGINNTRRFLTYNAEREVFILYYGEDLSKGLVLTNIGTMFPRELGLNVQTYIGFNQGVLFITESNELFQDFKKGTVIPDKSPIAIFETIGVRDNRRIISNILEVTELNGVEYTVTCQNEGIAIQYVKPSFNLLDEDNYLPNLLYSDDRNVYPSYEITSKWANKSANVTRVAAPMSGRDGITITIEFKQQLIDKDDNTAVDAFPAFCLSALRLPDFSQGN